MTKPYIATCAAILIVSLIGIANGHAADAVPATNKVDLLFVQNASSVVFADGKMTLKGVNPITVYFSDRPARIAGHLRTEELVARWGEGRDSFAGDPPNATLSLLAGRKLDDVVLELSNPQLKGTELTYDVKILQGQVPKTGRDCSLFIDVIGMPRTPYSYAGADRRSWGEPAVYGAPAVYARPVVYAQPVVVDQQVDDDEQPVVVEQPVDVGVVTE